MNAHIIVFSPCGKAIYHMTMWFLLPIKDVLTRRIGQKDRITQVSALVYEGFPKQCSPTQTILFVLHTLEPTCGLKASSSFSRVFWGSLAKSCWLFLNHIELCSCSTLEKASTAAGQWEDLETEGGLGEGGQLLNRWREQTNKQTDQTFDSSSCRTHINVTNDASDIKISHASDCSYCVKNVVSNSSGKWLWSSFTP